MKLSGFLAGVVMLLVSACGGGGSSATPAGVYLSLGDSVAAGSGASDAGTVSSAALVARDEGLELVNVAVAGATTADVIEKQLPQVGNAVRGREVALITLSVGGNDLAALIPNASCQDEPLPASCPLDEALVGVAERLETILSRLREAYPDAPIIMLAYPNFFSGTGHVFEGPASRVLPRLGETIRGASSHYDGVRVASPSFEGRGGELTHVLDERFDPHPNDAGHRLIAESIESEYGALLRQG